MGSRFLKVNMSPVCTTLSPWGVGRGPFVEIDYIYLYNQLLGVHQVQIRQGEPVKVVRNEIFRYIVKHKVSIGVCIRGHEVDDHRNMKGAKVCVQIVRYVNHLTEGGGI